MTPESADLGPDEDTVEVHQAHDTRRLDEDAVRAVVAAVCAGEGAEAEWARVRQRCLTVAVAMLEEAR